MASGRTSAPRPVKPPRVVGRYALFDEIASGGMATVHLGRLVGPVGFSRTIAIKRLHPQFSKDPEFTRMFLDEARLASRIQHPNVVSTIDVVSLEGEVFLVMEYVQGESLHRLLGLARENDERMPLAHVVSVMTGVLHGLHAAHEAKSERREALNIVHRDVSPHNVLVGTDGVGRVLDFGVAKAALRSQSTREGQMKGKLGYMSPEQLNGREVDRRTDVFAAGVILWEALTGERLFSGVDAGEIIARVLTHEIPDPATIATDLPRGLTQVVLKALSRDVDARYQTARDFAIELERCVPLSTTREVGEWVERLGGAVLSGRAQLVQDIETASTDLEPPRSVPTASDLEEGEVSTSGPRPRVARKLSVPPSPAPAPGLAIPQAPPASSTPPAAGVPAPAAAPRATSAATPASDGSRLAIFAVCACLAGGVLAFFMFGKLTGDARRDDASAAASSPTRVAAQSSPEGREGSIRENAPTFSIDQLPQAAAADAGAAPTRRAPAAPRRRAAARPSAKNCSPPWTVDANGIRRPKPECL